MSVIENQTLDQIQGVDTDAAFNQTAAKLSGESANYCACVPNENYVCDACTLASFSGLHEITANDVIDTVPQVTSDGTFESKPAKKPRKPRQPKKQKAGSIATAVQRDLHFARMRANRKIERKLLLPDDYKKAYEFLDAALQQAMVDLIPLCVGEMDKVGEQ